MNLYEILGVAKDAGSAAIKAAYRKLAQQHHPDKGGDKDRFQAIQQAYEVLSDDERRADYDATGEVRQQGPTLRQEAMEIVCAVVDEALESYDPVHDNLIDRAVLTIESGIRKLEDQVKSLTQRHARVSKAIGRASAKAGNEDVVSPIFARALENIARPLENAKRHIVKCREAIKILREHDYHVDARPADQQRRGKNDWAVNEMLGGSFGNAFNRF